MTHNTVDDALAVFVDVLDRALKAHVPQETKTIQKSSLPWLNDVCCQAIYAKHAAEGQVNYNLFASKYNLFEVLLGETKEYLAQLRAKIEKLPENSKRWCSLN